MAAAEMSFRMPIYSDTPWLKLADMQVFEAPSWHALDEIASAWLGTTCLALPSIRVGLCWALEQREFARHRDHILVPRFTGRCILNCLGRFALPVESLTEKTRIAVVVHQFGRHQNIDVVGGQLAKNGCSYIEDSPYGVGDDECLADGSLGRFIGLGKVLPIVQGALFVSGDEAISRQIELKRQQTSPWALPVWLTMLLLRKQFSGGYSEMADAAYEMYPGSRGGCRYLRGNLSAVFKRIEWFERESRDRMLEASKVLGACALLPDKQRLGYVIPFLPGVAMATVQSTLRRLRFSDAALHIDLNSNMLAPDYVKCLTLPVNPYIPRACFDQLLDGLRSISELGMVARGRAT